MTQQRFQVIFRSSNGDFLHRSEAMSLEEAQQHAAACNGVSPIIEVMPEDAGLRMRLAFDLVDGGLDGEFQE